MLARRPGQAQARGQGQPWQAVEVGRRRMAIDPALEICLCAAIRMPDGEVVRGHRHDNCYDVVRARLMPSLVLDGARAGGKVLRVRQMREAIIAAEQGFLTSRGRFVDRREGMALMRASGLPSHYSADGGYNGDDLFSEDLYPNGPDNRLGAQPVSKVSWR
jgi:hypothetical protein